MRAQLICILAILLSLTGHAQVRTPCQPPSLSVSREANIFTDAQEVDLGDAVAEKIQHEFRVIDDDDVTAYLNAIGQRIVKHLPPNKLQFRFTLVDLPMANAFALPGGRLYISRKLIAFVHSEDE